MLPYYFLVAQIFGFGLPPVRISLIHAISTSIVVGLRSDDTYFDAIFLFFKFTELEILDHTILIQQFTDVLTMG